jgi:hypothetical protein
MTRKWLNLMTLAAMVLTTAGCLHKDTRHSLYLSADGGLVWTVIEKDVRSNERDPVKRSAEEQEYLRSALEGRHPVGLGLARLAPDAFRTTVIRPSRPFVVATEAGFDRIDRVFDRVLAETRTPGYAILSRNGKQTTLVVHVDPGAVRDEDDDDPSPVGSLLDDLDRYRIVLVDGKFVSAKGFSLADDGSAAELEAMSEEQAAAAGYVLEWTITWEAAAAPATSAPRISGDRSWY